MKSLKNVLWLALMYAIVVACTKNPATPPLKKDPGFRVLGYLSSRHNWNNDLAGIDLSKITDLNLAFLNPDSLGNFTTDDELQKVVQKAHDYKVRIFFSIGGGSAPVYFANLVKPGQRTNLINSLAELAVKYDFDGVDVDIENDLITPDYGGFIADLSVALKEKKKLMSSAQAAWNGNKIDDQTFAKFDFINIMSYDKTGPWTPDSPGPHAPFIMAQEDFNYFNKTRNIPAEKLLIGLPFYGYQFGTIIGSLNYKTIISLYPGSENKDSIDATDGSRIYYNGLPTIRQKVGFALTNKAAGVMIWELHQDSNDSKSLLKAINEVKSHWFLTH